MKNPILLLSMPVLIISILLYQNSRGAYQPAGAGKSATVMEEPQVDVPTLTNKDETMGPSRGKASFYSVSSNGTRTASGVPLSDSASTAAHRTLPFGTRVRVTNLSNGQSDVVEITDRGPFVKGRIIDVSQSTAGKLGMIKAGIASVEIEVLPKATGSSQISLTKEL